MVIAQNECKLEHTHDFEEQKLFDWNPISAAS